MDRTETYLLLDAARCGMDAIGQAQDLCRGPHESLYALNDTNRHLGVVAPYLFRLEEGLKNWYLENGYGKAWGIVVFSTTNIEELRGHFRKFLKVKTEEGKQLYFRFYDPRVLKIFLPTCDEDQVIEFFGPVQRFLMEYDTEEEAIEFRREKGVLHQQRRKIGEIVTG